MIWCDRSTLRREWDVEAAFGVGFIIARSGDTSIPQSTSTVRKVPDLVFINDYMQGTRLPALDRWLPPFHVDFYYSFQHLLAALLGRWFSLEPTVCYHFAFCVISGLSSAPATRRCAGCARGGRLVGLVTIALLVGGCGLGLTIQLTQKGLQRPGVDGPLRRHGQDARGAYRARQMGCTRMSKPGADWLGDPTSSSCLRHLSAS